MDGICCGYGAKGWVTITSGDGVLSSLAGDLIRNEPVVVGLEVDANGTVAAAASEKSDQGNEVASPTATPTTQTTATTNAGSTSSFSVNINPVPTSPTPIPTTPLPIPMPTTPEPAEPYCTHV